MTAENGPDSSADRPSPAGDIGQSLIDAPTPDAEAQFTAETAAHSRQTRIGWEVVAGVIAVTLIAGAAAYALLGTHPASDESGPVPSATPAVPSSGASESGAASRTATEASGSPTAGVSARVKPTDGRVARSGSPLPELSGPPPKTVSMLVVPKGFALATYDIVFRPYGWGPGGPSGGRIVIRIDSAKPADSGARTLGSEFKDRNASVWCVTGDVKTLDVGGTYRGTLSVRPQGDVGWLYLSGVEFVK